MEWFDKKDEINVKEIEHVRGSRILTDRPKKTSAPRWFDPSDPTTHDLPPKPDNYVEVQNQTLSRELVLEDIELPSETATKHLVVSGGTGAGKTQAIHRVLDRVLWGAANGEKAIITDSGGQFFEARSEKGFFRRSRQIRTKGLRVGILENVGHHPGGRDPRTSGGTP